MIALANITDEGLSFVSRFARKIFYDRVKLGLSVTFYIDKRTKHLIMKNILNKKVVENTEYTIIYSRVIAMFEHNEKGLKRLYPNNLTRRELKTVKYLNQKIKSQDDLHNITKVIVGYPFIKYRDFLIVLDKSPFNALSCDYSAFLIAQDKVAESFEDVWGDFS